MRDREINLLKTFQRIDAEFDSSITIVNTLQALAAKHSELKTKIELIIQADTVVISPNKGKTAAKNSVKSEAIELCITAVGALFSYASDKQNVQLKEESDISGWKLKQLRDIQLPIKIQAIITLMTPYINELKNYGFTNADLENLTNKLNELQAKHDAKNLGIGSKSAARKTLDKLFIETNELLEVIDRLMLKFKKSEVDFYNRYMSARNVEDLGGGHKEKPEPPPAPPQQ